MSVESHPAVSPALRSPPQQTSTLDAITTSLARVLSGKYPILNGSTQYAATYVLLLCRQALNVHFVGLNRKERGLSQASAGIESWTPLIGQ